MYVIEYISRVVQRAPVTNKVLKFEHLQPRK
jgi:hypothetical protein